MAHRHRLTMYIVVQLLWCCAITAEPSDASRREPMPQRPARVSRIMKIAKRKCYAIRCSKAGVGFPRGQARQDAAKQTRMCGNVRLHAPECGYVRILQKRGRAWTSKRNYFYELNGPLTGTGRFCFASYRFISLGTAWGWAAKIGKPRLPLRGRLSIVRRVARNVSALPLAHRASMGNGGRRIWQVLTTCCQVVAQVSSEKQKKSREAKP